MRDEEQTDEKIFFGQDRDRLEFAEALHSSSVDWGETLVLRPESLISDLSDEHLEILEGIAEGVDSIDSLAGYCEREIALIEDQVGTLVEKQIASYDDEGRLIIPERTIVSAPISIESKNDPNAPTNSPSVATKRKVGRVVEMHDLHDFHDRLPAMWLGAEEYQKRSTGRIAELLNTKLIHSHLEDVIDHHMEGEADDILRRLKSEDPGKRAAQEERLEKLGIDPDDIKNELVSPQSMFRYLTETLDLEHREDLSEFTEDTLSSLRDLRSKQELIVEHKLRNLTNTDEIDIDQEDIDISIQLMQDCTECYAQHNVLNYLQHGGCPNSN